MRQLQVPTLRTYTLLTLSLCGVACNAASSSPGSEAWLHVAGAQFREQPVPLGGNGPAVQTLTSFDNQLILGQETNQLRGALAADATALIIGLEGEGASQGSWIIPAGLPDVETPGLPSIEAGFGLQLDAPAGLQRLVAVATRSSDPSANDEGLVVGPRFSLELLAVPIEPPTGELVVSLTWTGSADLDLHVVDPLGGEAWSGDPNTYQLPPPGEPVDPEGFRDGGILDHDGNADCRRDAIPQENVVWQRRPPAGRYIVRVDARSLCQRAIAHWLVVVRRGDQVLASVEGRSVPGDELNEHRAGAGVQALTFDVP